MSAPEWSELSEYVDQVDLGDGFLLAFVHRDDQPWRWGIWSDVVLGDDYPIDDDVFDDDDDTGGEYTPHVEGVLDGDDMDRARAEAVKHAAAWFGGKLAALGVTAFGTTS